MNDKVQQIVVRSLTNSALMAFCYTLIGLYTSKEALGKNWHSLMRKVQGQCNAEYKTGIHIYHSGDFDDLKTFETIEQVAEAFPSLDTLVKANLEHMTYIAPKKEQGEQAPGPVVNVPVPQQSGIDQRVDNLESKMDLILQLLSK